MRRALLTLACLVALAWASARVVGAVLRWAEQPDVGWGVEYRS